MTVAKVPLPEVPIGEWTVLRPHTAPGLFAYRHVQADGLLQLPDYADDDMSREQRRAALDKAVEFKRPLTALVIFLNVVALEDFLRDLGARLADVRGFTTFFPNAAGLATRPRTSRPGKPYARLDQEPISSFLDFEALNQLYETCLGVRPVDPAHFPRLYDLALLRHTVAHHGAIIRAIDVPRFQYYEVQEKRLINPPVEFVKETCRFVYSVGREFETKIQDHVFPEIISRLNPSWQERPPQILVDLIEVFSYLGKLLEDNEPVPMIADPVEMEKHIREKGERFRQELIRLCLADLKNAYGGASNAV